MVPAAGGRTVSRMTAAAPFEVLIAGGGPAAIEAALTLRALAPGLRVEILCDTPDLVYRPLSVVEPFARPGARRYPLAWLAEHGVQVRDGTLDRVDVGRRVAFTATAEEIPYDALMVAIGARQHAAAPDALDFGGPAEAEAMHGLIQDVESGYVHSVAFWAPPGETWTLPIYELALQTAERANEMGADAVELTVTAAEARPLELFGDAASELVEGLLAAGGIRYLSGNEAPAAERRVALPLLEGRRLEGLPATEHGFLPVDGHGLVTGTRDVWAAGDGTDSPIKQGGLATQQAGAAARAIVAAAGLPVESTPFEPVLRAQLIAGRQTWFLRRRLNGFDLGQVSMRALWWPPTKIAGHYLGPYLAELEAAGHALRLEPEPLA
jgi:sulfide:quinone oxidoreductase